MKLSTILSFAALSATATLAFPLSPFRALRARDDLEERDVYAPAPVRRSASSATPTATATDTASATSTISASEATATTSDSPSSSSGNSTDTWLYSTITQNGSISTPPASTSTLDPTTETASTTTETDYPQSTSTGASHNNGNNNNNSSSHNNNSNNNNNNNNENVDVNISQQIIIRIKEVIKVTQVIVVEKPILVAVQVNVKVRQTIIVNQIKNVFITRFDTWDQSVVDQLGLIISQQFEILTQSSNSGFDNLSNDQYNQFVSKFISQFSVFQTFRLVDVQQFVIVLKGFGVNQLASFFGRSDALFSQATFSKFNVNNDFKVFVQQLTVMVEAVSVDSFNSDDLFGLVSGSLFAAGSIQV